MENLKKQYKNYLYKYLGAEVFNYKKVNIDKISESVFLILSDFYNQAVNDFESACNIEQFDDTFYKYKKVMNETLDSYITIYCEINRIDYEKIKYNIYLINNKKEVNIEDGFAYIYSTLNKISKRKKFTRKLIRNMKDTIKFR